MYQNLAAPGFTWSAVIAVQFGSGDRLFQAEL